MAQIDWHDFVVVETIEPSTWTSAFYTFLALTTMFLAAVCPQRFTAEDDTLQLVLLSAESLAPELTRS